MVGLHSLRAYFSRKASLDGLGGVFLEKKASLDGLETYFSGGLDGLVAYFTKKLLAWMAWERISRKNTSLDNLERISKKKKPG